jgi:hypothetical protein
VVKEKPKDEKIKDAKKLKDEMVEGKTPDEVAAIYKKGNKYYCAECHSELPMHTDCPKCHAHIDWDRILMERR